MKKTILAGTLAVCTTSLLGASDEFTTFNTLSTEPTGTTVVMVNDEFNISPSYGYEQTVQIDEQAYRVGRVNLNRTTTMNNGFEFNVEVFLYKKGVTGINKPQIVSFLMYMTKEMELTDTPCEDYRCRTTNFELEETRRAFTQQDLIDVAYNNDAMIRGVYERGSFGIKSVEYNWATGEWKNLVLASLTYKELQLVPVLHPGLTVGNL